MASSLSKSKNFVIDVGEQVRRIFSIAGQDRQIQLN
jgi:hypothetical protein